MLLSISDKNITIFVELEGLSHVPRPRNFHTINVVNNLKDFLANCRWQFSPSTASMSWKQSNQLSYSPICPEIIAKVRSYD